MNQAISFIDEYKDEYHINMDNVILMGSSAGAIMAAQFGMVISNPKWKPLDSLAHAGVAIPPDYLGS